MYKIDFELKTLKNLELKLPKNLLKSQSAVKICAMATYARPPADHCKTSLLKL